MRKLCALVPAPPALATACHVPAIVVTPPVEVRNTAGKVMVHSSPVGSPAAQFAGSAPENILSVPEAPTLAWICAT